MKRKLTKFISLIFVLCISASAYSFSAEAVSYQNSVKVNSDAALLVEAGTGQAVYSKNSSKKMFPASTTKIMTYIVVAETVKELEKTEVEIKSSALKRLEGTGSSTDNVGSYIGSKMTVLDLLYSMMVPSGNDAAAVLADYVGNGDVETFVSKMNDKAKVLGCENTHFVNPEGLHDKNHYTTAADLYKITKYALTMPMFKEITSTTTHYCKGSYSPLVTVNYMIDENRGGDYYYQYAKGVKTGSDENAGRCLVTTAEKDGSSYIAVLLGAPYDSDSIGTMTDAKNLFTWAFDNLGTQTVASPSTPVAELKINLAKGRKTISVVPTQDVKAIVPNNVSSDSIVVEHDLAQEVEAPVTTSDVLGTAKIYYKDSAGKKQYLAQVNLAPSENAERNTSLAALMLFLKTLLTNWPLFVAAIAAGIFLICVIAKSVALNRFEIGRVKKIPKIKKEKTVTKSAPTKKSVKPSSKTAPVKNNAKPKKSVKKK